MRDELRIQVRLPDRASVTEKHRAMMSVLKEAEYRYRHYVEGGGLDQDVPLDLPNTRQGAAAIGDFMNEVRGVIGATSEARRQQRSWLTHRLSRRNREGDSEGLNTDHEDGSPTP